MRLGLIHLVLLSAALIQAMPLRNCEMGALALGVSCHEDTEASLHEVELAHCDDSPCSTPGDEPTCRMCDDKTPVERPVTFSSPAVAHMAAVFQLDLTLLPTSAPPLPAVAVHWPPRTCSLPLLI
jgi:hypothetical protein